VSRAVSVSRAGSRPHSLGQGARAGLRAAARPCCPSRVCLSPFVPGPQSPNCARGVVKRARYSEGGAVFHPGEGGRGGLDGPGNRVERDRRSAAAVCGSPVPGCVGLWEGWYAITMSATRSTATASGRLRCPEHQRAVVRSPRPPCTRVLFI
jgi:hypothetical protein